MKNDNPKTRRFRESENALFKAFNLEKKEHFVKVPQHNIDVRVQELGTGEPLLFIHGGPNAGSTWVQLSSYFKDFRCLLLDRPGCGLSDAVDYRNMNRDKLHNLIVDVCESTLDYFQIDNIPLIGSSFGSYCTFVFAMQKPHRVKKIVVEGCPALVEGMIIPKFMKMMTNSIMRRLIPLLPTSKSYSKKIMKDIGHAHSIESNIMSEVFINWYVSLSNNTDTLKNDISGINLLMPGGEMDPQFILTDDQIARISQPTLWLWGNDDPFGGIELGKRISSRMPNSIFKDYKNQGHLPWLDNPQEHAEKISEFLKS